MIQILLKHLPILILASFSGPLAHAQVNSGSDGSDGAFNPIVSTNINLGDRPNGIYQFTSVNIPVGVTVTFTPNTANTPVYWLVKGDCIIEGIIDISGAKSSDGSLGGTGGPGGFAGGSSGGGGAAPGSGKGPGGGPGATGAAEIGGNASFVLNGYTNRYCNQDIGETYGSSLLVPLIGGSGGGAGRSNGTGAAGGGGGGAILIAANNSIQMDGIINCSGADGTFGGWFGGAGSGGAIRLVATEIRGVGNLQASGGFCRPACGNSGGADGVIRFDAFQNSFSGIAERGVITRGFQPIILLPPEQNVALAIESVGGIATPANPGASALRPDVILPGIQTNPIQITVRCVNIPLNTEIIVDVKPANGTTIRTVGLNSNGVLASSTATVSMNLPRGGGTIQAKAAVGIAAKLGASIDSGKKNRSYAETGLTVDGEIFSKMEITSILGGSQQIAYVTPSGKKFILPRK